MNETLLTVLRAADKAYGGTADYPEGVIAYCADVECWRSAGAHGNGGCHAQLAHLIVSEIMDVEAGEGEDLAPAELANRVWNVLSESIDLLTRVQRAMHQVEQGRVDADGEPEA